jgi:hypothetical protein
MSRFWRVALVSLLSVSLAHSPPAFLTMYLRYIVQRFVPGSAPKWHIRRLGITGVLQTLSTCHTVQSHEHYGRNPTSWLHIANGQCR